MPGILPMKVIKVGTNAQSRIAQACDRCRSKKIRCDGVTPCCSQCKNVGFECKTSDKLSRRAFPRGYTESLEERVRALECEVRELKDLLDEKDEKIEMLSKIHDFSTQRRRPSAVSVSPTREVAPTPAVSEKEDTVKIQQSPFLMESEQSDAQYFMGPSSGRCFVDAFKSKMHESGKSFANFDTNAFFHASQVLSSPSDMPKIPPRVVSDQLINIFFQEWAPLFPVLHRPSFLKVYADYSADPESLKDSHQVAQLYLVFGTAALASQSNTDLLPAFEAQWYGALESVIHENSLATLQCLLLAQIYCIAKSDNDRLLHYTGIAVNLSNRLGLHQTQKRFTLGALTRETRKKVFWTLYTLDCFAAATLGLPKLIKDADVETEEPADVDDENVTERGFQATLPGESTKLSSALAFFRAARVLSKVLEQEYPASTSHEISVQQIGALSDELDAWRDALAPHLRLEFVQDKPSTNVISSRSPLLSLAYYYIRTLIHRPLATSGLGAKAQPSLVALADSSKHIVQIIQLLEERHMSFTMCLNKSELLVLSGFGLLYQGLGLKIDGMLIRDNQRLLCAIIELLKPTSALTAVAFKRVACAVLTVDTFAKPTLHRTSSHESARPAMRAPELPSQSPKNQLQAIASRFSFNTPRPVKKEHQSSRRSTVPHVPLQANLAIYSRQGLQAQASQTSLNSVASEPLPARKTKRSGSNASAATQDFSTTIPNLDYLPLDSHSPSQPAPPNTKSAVQNDFGEWGELIGYFENFDSNSPVHSQHGVPSYISPEPITFTTPQQTTSDWSPEGWTIPHDFAPSTATATSVFSLSDESLTSGEDLSSCDFGNEIGGFALSTGDDFRLHEFENSLGV